MKKGIVNGADVIRTDKEVDELIQRMSQGLEHLPDRDNWGRSNLKAKREAQSDIQTLEAWRKHKLLPDDYWTEAWGWLIGADWATIGRDYDLT